MVSKRVSEQFFHKTQQKYVFNIMPMANIPSVMRHGILSNHRARSIENHKSIALQEVQTRRDGVMVPGGKDLHSYANLYFDARNPMMYRRKAEAETLCVLVVSAEVMDLANVIVTDRNAASPYARFEPAAKGIEIIQFDKVYAVYWTNDDPYAESEHKKIKCAEVLVPDCVPYELVRGAYVANDSAKKVLMNYGFEREVRVRPSAFFSSNGH